MEDPKPFLITAEAGITKEVKCKHLLREERDTSSLRWFPSGDSVLENKQPFQSFKVFQQKETDDIESTFC